MRKWAMVCLFPVLASCSSAGNMADDDTMDAASGRTPVRVVEPLSGDLGLPDSVLEEAALLAKRAIAHPDNVAVSDSLKSEALDMIISVDSMASLQDSVVVGELLVSRLDSIQHILERAQAVNELDVEIDLLVSQVLLRKAAVAPGDSMYHAQAEPFLDRLKRTRTGDYIVWSVDADLNYYASNWEVAAASYGQAESMLLLQLELSDDSLSENQQDALFGFRFSKGRAHIERNQSDEALKALQSARVIADQDEEVKSSDYWLSYVLWDDGNIENRREYDHILAHQADSLEWAMDQFMVLSRKLANRSARDEVEWRLGIVETNLGKNTEAAERLWRLVERTPKEVVTGIPIDSTYVKYFADFGRVTVDLARNAKSAPEQVKYYERAVLVAWPGQNTARVSLADLIKSRNPGEAIRLLTAALEGPIPCESRRTAYSALVGLLRTTDVERAREFQQLAREAC